MNKIKTFLIQNTIAPYRIPLFQLLSDDPALEFSAIQLARKEPHRKEWTEEKEYPFPVKTLKGFCYSRNFEDHVRLNPSLVWYLMKEKPDVLIIGGFSFASLISVVIKKAINCKIVLWFEGTQYTEKNISKFRNKVRRFISQRVDSIIVASELSKQYLKTNLLNDHNPIFFTAYNNVDNEHFSNSIIHFREKMNFFTRFKRKYGEQVILYVGQFIERKGIWELLAAYKKIHNSHPDVSLILLGTGPLAKDINSYCQQHGLNRVFFEGFVKQDDIPKYYAIADVFVLLSHWDCNPLVIFEALASGVPIVSSYRVGNVPEFVINNYNGFVVDPFNTDEVADRILKILNDVKLRTDFSNNSQLLSEKSTYDDSYHTFKKAIFHVMGYDK